MNMSTNRREAMAVCSGNLPSLLNERVTLKSFLPRIPQFLLLSYPDSPPSSVLATSTLIFCLKTGNTIGLFYLNDL
jgi:hypothetical protein